MRKVLLQPFALTLWTMLQIEDVERVEALMERDGHFHLASVVAAAVLDGKAYESLRSRHVAELRGRPRVELSGDALQKHLQSLDDFAAENAKKFPMVS